MTETPARRSLATRILGVSDSRSAGLILLAALGVFFAADDQTSVVAVLPKMIVGINLPQDQFYRAAWIINAYILGYVVAMPLMGRVSDKFGHGRVFAASLGVFMIGSAWVALSRDLGMISVARAFQALGGGATVPVAMAIVADAMPAGRRALGLGAIAAATEAGALIGPLDGGLVGQLLGWQAVFWENIPLCLPIAIATWRMASRPERATASIDFPGGALFGASLVCLTVALTNDPIEPRPAQVTLGLVRPCLCLLRRVRFAPDARVRTSGRPEDVPAGAVLGRVCRSVPARGHLDRCDRQYPAVHQYHPAWLRARRWLEPDEDDCRGANRGHSRRLCQLCGWA